MPWTDEMLHHIGCPERDTPPSRTRASACGISYSQNSEHPPVTPNMASSTLPHRCSSAVWPTLAATPAPTPSGAPAARRSMALRAPSPLPVSPACQLGSGAGVWLKSTPALSCPPWHRAGLRLPPGFGLLPPRWLIGKPPTLRLFPPLCSAGLHLLRGRGLGLVAHLALRPGPPQGTHCKRRWGDDGMGVVCVCAGGGVAGFEAIGCVSTVPLWR